jgi:hypothetical protein
MAVENISVEKSFIIDSLVKSDLVHAEANPDYMEELLLFGFHGYMNASNESLINDYRMLLSHEKPSKFNITIKEES